ncbi:MULTISPECIES: DUF2493 domain-containing protein [Sphingobium]|jgi:hypothetical protein|uniref:DUF2493 domain-containing protein n=3 Tax=Sphingobium TaxID=165695 RepID=A0A6P1GEW6_SPHYA|nr:MULTISPECIES: SLOG family protein [Sphingobium]EQB16566.1 hypothetical protein RLDS_07040 [Sphingobium lactosutens DS20]QDC36679.1 DUF2493 domain-containing protein [Sphingobium fuliginis ATCC 27551]QHD66774.1 DUF2493 domain-containing protein [Sphingobium yanoikuyae]QNG43835.1 DUF2493 domain-containing protein [Sphingobium yanoikuyae]
MSKPTALASVSSFADLPELYAELTATPDFVASFGDPLPLTIIDAAEEPAEHTMPDPIAAQAECGGIVAAIFDLLTDTRLDPLAPELAWGFVNSFHFVANKLESREDRLADTLRDMARRLEPGEVFNKELEDTQLECQSVAEQRAAMEAMRDYAAAMYRVCAGRPWSPAKGSRASHVTTASQISALDFLRARSERRRDRYDPQGPVVVVSGPADWHDWRILWNRLDQIRTRIPNMVLVTTGQRLGVDAAAAAWAAQRGVVCIAFGLYGRGKGKGFKRNRDIAELMPVEAILCEGSGIQSSLYDLFNPSQGHRVPTHVFLATDQEPDVPIKKKRRIIAA